MRVKRKNDLVKTLKTKKSHGHKTWVGREETLYTPPGVKHQIKKHKTIQWHMNDAWWTPEFNTTIWVTRAQWQQIEKQTPKGTKCPTRRPSTGWRGNHDMLTTLRSICPTCGGSSTARECGTAAKALYTCLILMGYSSCVSGDGARGCTRGRGWGQGGGRVEKQAEDKKNGTANERQSTKGRAQEENAGLDRMQPAIAKMSMKRWMESVW